jgi:hypothetical protein
LPNLTMVSISFCLLYILSLGDTLQYSTTNNQTSHFTLKVNTAGDVVNIIPDGTAAQPQAGPSQSTRGKKRQRRDEEEEEEEEDDEMDEMDEVDKLPTGPPPKLARSIFYFYYLRQCERTNIVDQLTQIGSMYTDYFLYFRLHNRDRVWKKSKPSIFGMSVPDFWTQPMKTLPMEC